MHEYRSAAEGQELLRYAAAYAPAAASGYYDTDTLFHTLRLIT